MTATVGAPGRADPSREDSSRDSMKRIRPITSNSEMAKTATQ